MRKLTLAVVVLACATAPVLAQSPQGAAEPPAVEAPPPAPSVTPAKPQPAPAAAPPRSAAPAMPGNRFTFNRVDDGFLRLDNQTGQIAYCSPHVVGWGCQAVPEDRAALDKEIARLKDEVAALKAQIALMREPAPPPRPPADLTPAQPAPPQVKAPPPAAGKDQDVKLQQDLDRARVAFENAWRRLVEMIANLQRDLAHKS